MNQEINIPSIVKCSLIKEDEQAIFNIIINYKENCFDYIPINETAEDEELADLIMQDTPIGLEACTFAEPETKIKVYEDNLILYYQLASPEEVLDYLEEE